MERKIFFAFLWTIIQVEGSALMCGEDIVVKRGEKKTVRFWSTDDELMKVEVVPERRKSDGSALLAVFKDMPPLKLKTDQLSQLGSRRDDTVIPSGHLAETREISGHIVQTEELGGQLLDTDEISVPLTSKSDETVKLGGQLTKTEKISQHLSETDEPISLHDIEDTDEIIEHLTSVKNVPIVEAEEDERPVVPGVIEYEQQATFVDGEGDMDMKKEADSQDIKTHEGEKGPTLKNTDKETVLTASGKEQLLSNIDMDIIQYINKQLTKTKNSESIDLEEKRVIDAPSEFINSQIGNTNEEKIVPINKLAQNTNNLNIYEEDEVPETPDPYPSKNKFVNQDQEDIDISHAHVLHTNEQETSPEEEVTTSVKDLEDSKVDDVKVDDEEIYKTETESQQEDQKKIKNTVKIGIPALETNLKNEKREQITIDKAKSGTIETKEEIVNNHDLNPNEEAISSFENKVQQLSYEARESELLISEIPYIEELTTEVIPETEDNLDAKEFLDSSIVEDMSSQLERTTVDHHESGNTENILEVSETTEGIIIFEEDSPNTEKAIEKSENQEDNMPVEEPDSHNEKKIYVELANDKEEKLILEDNHNKSISNNKEVSNSQLESTTYDQDDSPTTENILEGSETTVIFVEESGSYDDEEKKINLISDQKMDNKRSDLEKDKESNQYIANKKENNDSEKDISEIMNTNYVSNKNEEIESKKEISEIMANTKKAGIDSKKETPEIMSNDDVTNKKGDIDSKKKTSELQSNDESLNTQTIPLFGNSKILEIAKAERTENINLGIYSDDPTDILIRHQSSADEDSVDIQELRDIMTHLKTQQDLLMHPGHTVKEGSASIDVKLNIIKNLIKGISLELESSGNTDSDDFGSKVASAYKIGSNAEFYKTDESNSQVSHSKISKTSNKEDQLTTSDHNKLSVDTSNILSGELSDQSQKKDLKSSDQNISETEESDMEETFETTAVPLYIKAAYDEIMEGMSQYTTLTPSTENEETTNQVVTEKIDDKNTNLNSKKDKLQEIYIPVNFLNLFNTGPENEVYVEDQKDSEIETTTIFTLSEDLEDKTLPVDNTDALDNFKKLHQGDAEKEAGSSFSVSEDMEDITLSVDNTDTLDLENNENMKQEDSEKEAGASLPISEDIEDNEDMAVSAVGNDNIPEINNKLTLAELIANSKMDITEKSNNDDLDNRPSLRSEDILDRIKDTFLDKEIENPSVINDDSVFSKETGSDSDLLRIRNFIMSRENNEDEIALPVENSKFIPFNLQTLNMADNPGTTSPKIIKDSHVIIQEPGSQVVYIKPNSKEKSKLEVNTKGDENNLNGKYEINDPILTTVQPEVESDTTILRETSVSTDPLLGEQISETETTTAYDTEAESFTTESLYSPESHPETEHSSENSDIGDVTVLYGIQEAKENMNSSESSRDQKNNVENSENKDGTGTEIPQEDKKDVIDLLEKFMLSEAETDTGIESNALANSSINEAVSNESTRKTENARKELETSLHNHNLRPNYESLNVSPNVLQTRKGYIEPNAQRKGGIQHRRDDSPSPYGGDYPFFIKLPGSPNAVPVFLQYEPIEVKYVDADKFSLRNQVKSNKDSMTSELNSDLRTSHNNKFNQHATSEAFVSSVPHKGSMDDKPVDFHLRPDPFFLMDPPNLGKEGEGTKLSDVDSSVIVNLKSNLNFHQEEKIPSVVVGKNTIYPGEYFLKNPESSFSSPDSSSLTNPVFSLGSMVSQSDYEQPTNPQYTPFPITTNPPKTSPLSTTQKTTTLTPEFSTSEPTTLKYIENAKDDKETTTTVLPPILTENILNDTTKNDFNYSTGSPPSIVYSPAPFIDFPDSYGPYDYPELPPDRLPVEESLAEKLQKFALLLNSSDSVNELDSDNLFEDSEVSEDVYLFTDDVPTEEDDFDIVALANFLHQNQKGWSEPKISMMSQTKWRGPSWDSIKYSNDNEGVGPLGGPLGGHLAGESQGPVASPWMMDPVGASDFGEGNEPRAYSAFYSPEEIPGLNPEYFSYRKMPATRKQRNLDSQVDGIVDYVRTLPLPLQRTFFDANDVEEKKTRRNKRQSSGGLVYCEWDIKTEPGLYLLVTFRNLSAPYTVDCSGAYIEIERENNGYDARWCGNNAILTGTRPHVIFAKSEVRITVYDNGDVTKDFGTGFEAEIEVIDLFDTQQYRAFIEDKATPKIRRLMRG